jgi:hypothetical protein
MKRSCSILAALAFCLFSQSAFADGVLMAWNPADVPGITEESVKAARQLDVAQILTKNRKVTSWGDALLLMIGSTGHKDDTALLRGLILQLNDRTNVRLEGTRRLVIWERIISGEIDFEGKGYQTSDDLFTVAGRANWILRNLTAKTFGLVKPKSSAEELLEIQKKWTRWINGETVEEYRSLFPAPEKAIAEISSIEALEGLIVSLRPTAYKTELTSACLKRMYNLDALPEDPNTPGALCSPDTYTYPYLTMLTGVRERHDHVWWANWWETNRSRLSWNQETGAFELKE